MGKKSKKKPKGIRENVQERFDPEAKIDSAAAKRLGLRILGVLVIVFFVLFAAVGFSFELFQAADGSRDVAHELCYFGMLTSICIILAMVFMQLVWVVKRAQRRRQLMKPLEQDDERSGD